jgi:predicted esterase
MSFIKDLDKKYVLNKIENNDVTKSIILNSIPQERRDKVGPSIIKDLDYYNTKLDFYEFKYSVKNEIAKAYLIISKNDELIIESINLILRGGVKDFGNTDLLQLFGNKFNSCELAIQGIPSIFVELIGLENHNQNPDANGVKDQGCIFEIVNELNELNINKINLIGHSSGANLAMLYMLHDNKLKQNIKKIVFLAGVVDEDLSFSERELSDDIPLRQVYSNYYNTSDKNELDFRTTINKIEKFPKDTEVLIFHGQSDDRVLQSHSIRLADELFKNNINFECHLYPYEGHVFRTRYNEVKELITKFIKK